jgi:hypothetical protein
MSDKLVIVVHGVGDPMPGDALGAFAEGITATLGYSECVARTIEHVQENRLGGEDWRVQTFPVHKTELISANSQHRLHLREVYWGDLSRVKGSVSDLAIAGVDLVFGLRHVVRVATTQARQISRNVRCSRVLAWIAANVAQSALAISRGPMFALNILVATVCLVFLMLRSVYAPDISEPQPIYWATLLGAGIVTVAGLVLRKRVAKTEQWSTSTVNWLMALGIATIAVVLVDTVQVYPLDSTLGRRGWLFLKHIDDFVSPATAAMSLVAVLLAATTASTVLFCGAAWWFAGCLADQDRTAFRRSLEVTAFCTVLSNTLFTFTALVGWTVAMKSMGEHTVRLRVEDGLHLFGVVWFGLAWLMVSFICIAAANNWANRCNSVAERSRYIVHPFVTLSMLIIALVWTALFIPLAFHLECKVAEGVARWWPQWLCSGGSTLAAWGSWVNQLDSEQLRDVAIAVTVAFAAIVWAFRFHLGTAVDLVLDVLSHFRVSDDPAVRGVKLTQWDTMVARFQAVTDAGMVQTNCTSMLVVAHSQGTMIAIEALGLFKNRSPVTRPSASWLKVGLVTMGSPVEHLYRHYFPRCYGIKDRAQAPHNVTSWQNIFRRDDFIGTSVLSPPPGFPNNTPILARGHTDYWRDRDVLAALRPLLT